MNYKQKFNFKKLLFGAVLLTSLVSGIAYYFSIERGPIYEFEYNRDAQDILALFKSDLYWLSASEHYSPEFALKYRTPHQDPRYLGTLNIKVLREDDTFIGFTAYYKETVTIGRILFVAVKPEFRGKSYGQKLVEYAMKDLISQGIKKINILTRTTNYAAQALYKRAGFKESYRDDVFVHFTYDVS